jgi:ribosomal protein L16 Arg81 hydroxylase
MKRKKPITIQPIQNKKKKTNEKSVFEIISEDSNGNSESKAKKVFEWLISPISISEFFSEYWEKKPLLINRKNKKYNENVFTKKDIESLLKNKNLKYEKDLDVTLYKDFKRETYNKEGVAKYEEVWKQFKEKDCSIRVN